MKLLYIIGIIYLLAGCATEYSFVIHPDHTVEAKSKSYREFAYFKMQYNPDTKLFEVIAVGVTDDTSEVVTAAIQAGAAIIPTLTQQQAFDYMNKYGTPPPNVVR